jgi:superfamily II DNA or RNA helicase
VDEPAAVEPAAVEPVEVDPVAVVPGTVEPSLAKSLSEDPVAEWIATDEFLLDESTAMEFNALESDIVEPARAELDNLESSVDDPGDFEPVAGVTSEELETLEDASEPDWLEMLEQPSTSSPGTHRITVRSVPDRPSSLTIALPQEPDLASCSAESPETSGDTSPDYTARDSSNLSISGNLSEIETSTAIAIPNERESSNAFEMPNALETSNDLGTIANSEAAPNPKPADPIGSPSSTDAPVVQSWNDVVQPVAVGGVAALPFEPTSGLRVPPPRVLSLRIPRPTVKVSGFTFPEAPWAAAWLTPTNASSNKAGAAPDGAPSADSAAAVENGTAAAAETAAEKPGKLTRIKPPGDVIKLEDRLYYVLQPPLESLMACGEIHMPFEPFPYQYEGIGFLYPRYTAVLADEMGLGKTMQAIMTIRLLLRAGEIRNVLLVCPKPLVSNWRREFQTWAPEIPVGIIEGDQARRHWQWRQASTPVKIANYELLMRDRDVLDANLHFDLVALDEAQRIKNKSSTTSEIVRSIARTRSWALTGTPVENSPEDIVGIFEFLSPGYLSNDMQPRRMGELVKDHILRRTKDMVLTDMPPKLFRDATLDLSPEQYETYRRAEDDGVMKLTEMGPGITIQHVFELVLRLKQICNFDPVTGASSKLERLEADLEEVVASGQKAILFTQWVVTIARLREKLARFGTLEYHGQLPHKQRETVIDQFKNDPSKRLIMMSYGAGSVGLNLQFCRYVFLFDRWWNPAIEDQAINRAHRIGVSGPVTVTRMITGGTIEERINQVLDEKRELFNSILSHADNSARGGLTQNEIFGLFNLKVQPKPKAA